MVEGTGTCSCEGVKTRASGRGRGRGGAAGREGSLEGARARFMRPLPSPLAQLSSRYNIVVYSEPRLRSVNHPLPLPPPLRLLLLLLLLLGWQQPTLRSPNLPDAAELDSLALSHFLSHPSSSSPLLPHSFLPFFFFFPLSSPSSPLLLSLVDLQHQQAKASTVEVQLTSDEIPFRLRFSSSERLEIRGRGREGGGC